MPRGGKKDGSTAESKTEGKLEELAGLVTTLVRVQAAKDEQAEKASSIQECRWRSMQQQFTEMQQQVSRITQERRQEGDTQDDSQVHGRSEYHDSDYEGPAGGEDEMFNQRRHSFRQQREPKLLPLSPEDDIEPGEGLSGHFAPNRLCKYWHMRVHISGPWLFRSPGGCWSRSSYLGWMVGWPPGESGQAFRMGSCYCRFNF
ncbi:hypothetical protein NQZ68_009918 [Dissostichus eleginoides]|nr:hypothetical protein NQZ68_009918 [Dissostichus eleginoides]